MIEARAPSRLLAGGFCLSASATGTLAVRRLLARWGLVIATRLPRQPEGGLAAAGRG